MSATDIYASHTDAAKTARRTGRRVYEVKCQHGGEDAAADQYGDVTCPCGRVLTARGDKIPAHAPNRTGSRGWIVK